MKRTNFFLSGSAFKLGAVKPVEALLEKENISAIDLAAYRERGLASFCEHTGPTSELYMASISETLDKAALTPSEIDAVIFSSSASDWTSEDETALLTALQKFGFLKTRLVGLSLQACSGCGEALRLACDLLGGSATNVLVVICGRTPTHRRRISPRAATIFSDGAASCIVSSSVGEFEILSASGHTNIPLSVVSDRTGSLLSPLKQIKGAFGDLRALSRQVCDLAEVSRESIRSVFCTNGSNVHAMLISEAAEIPLARVYTDDIPLYGHVYSCDNLISLTTYSIKNQMAGGSLYMLVGWSPYIFSAAILRSTSDF